MRPKVLAHHPMPVPTGLISYRTTISLEDLLSLEDSRIAEMVNSHQVGQRMWLGPGAHVVWYPIKNGRRFNLVVVVQEKVKEEDKVPGQRGKQQKRKFDDVGDGDEEKKQEMDRYGYDYGYESCAKRTSRRTTRSVAETYPRTHTTATHLRRILATWDPALRLMLSRITGRVTKRKLCTMVEPESWFNVECFFFFLSSLHPPRLRSPPALGAPPSRNIPTPSCHIPL